MVVTRSGGQKTSSEWSALQNTPPQNTLQENTSQEPDPDEEWKGWGEIHTSTKIVLFVSFFLLFLALWTIKIICARFLTMLFFVSQFVYSFGRAFKTDQL